MAKKIMQPPTKKPVNSDSLMNESNRKKAIAIQQEKFGNAAIKAGRGNQKRVASLKGDMTPSGYERLDIAKNMRKQATSDSLAAVKGYPKAMAAITPKKLGKPTRKPIVKKK